MWAMSTSIMAMHVIGPRCHPPQPSNFADDIGKGRAMYIVNFDKSKEVGASFDSDFQKITLNPNVS